MKAVKLVAQPREAKGKGAVGRLRRQGKIPAVVYGSGKDIRLVELAAHDFEQTLKGHSSEHMIMDLEVGGDQPLKVLLKETQHHPVSGKVIHVDFNEISMTKKLRIEIPVRLVGEPVGVTQQGGTLEPVLRQIEVECLPTDIVEQFDIDVSGLQVGESVTAGDLQLDTSKYTILTHAELAIASVAAPRVEEATPAEAAAAAAGAAEPEVIMEKKEEGEAAEGKKEGKAEAQKGK